MSNTAAARPISADDIAEKAMAGQDISQYFANTGMMHRPVDNVTLHLTVDMLHEIDSLAVEMNIDRQAAIKACLRMSLDQHYLAKQWRHERQREHGAS